MITYSDCLLKLKDKLQELGLEGESPILQKFGNTVFTGNEDQVLAKVLEWEIQLRTQHKELQGKETELGKLREEKDKKEMLTMRVSQEVGKYFPKEKMRNEAYKTLYDGFMDKTVKDVIKSGAVSLDENHDLVIGEPPAKHPENMSALDRLLHDAHVVRYSSKDTTLENLITDTVRQGGAHNFFKI